MEALGLVLASVIGLSLGLLGGGGSILTVPVFVYVLGYAAKPAIAMSLPVVGATSLVGAIGHWRAGNVNFRQALTFGIVAMVGAFAGARLAVLVSGVFQLTLLAVAMLGAALSMLRRPIAQPPGSEAVSRWVVLVVGLGVGLLTGLVGIGGGFLIVPALVVLARVPMKQAVGTSLLVIAMNSASGFLGYLGQVDVPWGFMAVFTAIAIGGILVGTYLVRFVSQQALKRSFAVFLLVMAGVILYQNRGVFSL
ncbi:MAG TPA: sulfite exporter TauE/SafE family protein [Gemmatimonadaceae bacterium]|nr:sulfite exporter TauE/SafE family protein [Gemmatimonadaceae bacterium]